MKVSIIVPMKNAMPFVSETVDALLKQTFQDIEVLVVDDNSTDESYASIEGLKDQRIRLMRNQGSGWPAGFNMALAQASGDLVMKCDADDIYPRQRVATQVQWMKEHPQAGAVAGSMTFVWSNGAPVIDTPLGADQPEQIDGWLRSSSPVPIHHCAGAYRTEVIRAMGGMRTWFRTCSDLDFLRRLGESTEVWYHPHHAYIARLHSSSVTRTNSVERLAWFESQVEKFQLQRLATGRDDLMNGQPPEVPEFHAGSRRTPAMAAGELLVGASWRELARGNRLKAIQYSCRHVRYEARRIIAWNNLAKIVIKSVLS